MGAPAWVVSRSLPSGAPVRAVWRPPGRARWEVDLPLGCPKEAPRRGRQIDFCCRDNLDDGTVQSYKGTPRPHVDRGSRRHKPRWRETWPQEARCGRRRQLGDGGASAAALGRGGVHSLRGPQCGSGRTEVGDAHACVGRTVSAQLSFDPCTCCIMPGTAPRAALASEGYRCCHPFSVPAVAPRLCGGGHAAGQPASARGSGRTPRLRCTRGGNGSKRGPPTSGTAHTASSGLGGA